MNRQYLQEHAPLQAQSFLIVVRNSHTMRVKISLSLEQAQGAGRVPVWHYEKPLESSAGYIWHLTLPWSPSCS